MVVIVVMGKDLILEYKSNMPTLRSDWFVHVEKTRKKLSRGQKEQVAHRVAMKAASITWPKEKEKLLRKRRREAKKQTCPPKKTKVDKPTEEKNTE